MKTLRAKRATLAVLSMMVAASLLAGCSERIYMPKVRKLLESARSGAFRKAYACTSEDFLRIGLGVGVTGASSAGFTGYSCNTTCSGVGCTPLPVRRSTSSSRGTS